MSIFVGTASMKDHAASIELSAAIAAGAQYGLALDGFTMSFSGDDQSIGILQAKMPAQGLANANQVLRSIMFFQLASGSTNAEVTASALGLTCIAGSGANPDISLGYFANVNNGGSGTYSLPYASSYAYPALAGFNVTLSGNSQVSSIVYKSGLQNNGVPSGNVITWSPTVTINSNTGGAAFLIVGISSGSSIPAAAAASWSPTDTPMMSVTFSNLPVSVSSAAILIDSIDLEFSSSHNILDLAVSAGNDTAVVTCTPNGSTYDATVRFVPQLMMRDGSGHQLDSSSSIGFRVLVFPGTPVQTQG